MVTTWQKRGSMVIGRQKGIIWSGIPLLPVINAAYCQTQAQVTPDNNEGRRKLQLLGCRFVLKGRKGVRGSLEEVVVDGRECVWRGWWCVGVGDLLLLPATMKNGKNNNNSNNEIVNAKPL